MNRKNIRLPGYDYSQPGGYFITFCTEGRAETLGEVVGGGVLDAPVVKLSEFGVAVKRCIQEVKARYEQLSVPCYVIMPNHVHLMVLVGLGSSGTPTPTNQTIPALVSSIKRLTNRVAGKSLWQRGYYDHIVRNEDDYLQICSYIESNPARWAEDEYYCGNCSMP